MFKVLLTWFPVYEPSNLFGKLVNDNQPAPNKDNPAHVIAFMIDGCTFVKNNKECSNTDQSVECVTYLTKLLDELKYKFYSIVVITPTNLFWRDGNIQLSQIKSPKRVNVGYLKLVEPEKL